MSELIKNKQLEWSKPLALFSSDDKPESLSGDFKTDVGVFTKTI